MQALMFKDYRQMALEEVPSPSPGPGEVLVEVTACGVCGSDLEGYAGSPGMRARRTPPLLLGHEFSGVVRAGPSERVGQAVAVNPLISCGDCPICRAGKRHLCPDRTLIGLNRPGAFAEQAAVPQGQLYPLPEEVPPSRGALAEPLAVALHALELVGHFSGRRVLVFGGGAIGFLVAWVAGRAGARVTVVEISETRRQQLITMGFEAVAAPEGDAEVTVDTVGLDATRKAALTHLTPGGTSVFVGLHHDDSTLPLYPLILQERRIQGSYTYTDGDYRRAVALVNEVPEAFFTRLPLEAGPEAFETSAQGKTTHLKILLEPGHAVDAL